MLYPPVPHPVAGCEVGGAARADLKRHTLTKETPRARIMAARVLLCNDGVKLRGRALRRRRLRLRLLLELRFALARLLRRAFEQRLDGTR